MPKASPILTSFNSGEFSPLMAGRADIKYWPNACKNMRNFIPCAQGPGRRRPGTRYVAPVKTSANRTWLARFEFNVEQAYILEFGNLYIRFFSNHGVVGAPLEVVTPYTTADLISDQGTFALRLVQSGDTVYIFHRSFAPRKLTRTGAAAFNIATLTPEGGPFKDLDPDATTTVYSSAQTGAATLTASTAIFLAGHVGSLFYLEQKDIDAIAEWESGKVIAINAVRRSDGKNYHALTAATTGTARPVHSRGARLDGNTGVQWQFDDPGYGWCLITAIGGGGTTATVTILSRIPDGAYLVGNASTRWAHASWSDVEGWPVGGTFFRERLCVFRDRKIWGSVSSDFENFKDRDAGGLVVRDASVAIDITSDRANQIEWIAPSDIALLVGTAGDEHAVNEITTTEPFGPGNTQARQQTTYGSRKVPIARVGEGVIFAQKAGRKVRDMKLAESINERWMAPDLTVISEHVTKSGVVDMAYQQEPDSVLWCVKENGGLVGLTMNREQEVRGWHPHRFGGWSDSAQSEFSVIESVASIPSPDGDRDETWFIVRRYVNGATVRTVEYIEQNLEMDDDPQGAFFVDCGLSLNNTKAVTLTPGVGATVKGTTGVIFIAGAAIFAAGDVGKQIQVRYTTVDVTGKITWRTAKAEITAFNSNVNVTCKILSAFPSTAVIASGGWKLTVTTITGLAHLEGQTVQVCANGANHPDRTVTGGTITLTGPNSWVHVGLGCRAVLQPMPIEAGAADGTAQGKKQRISHAVIRFDQTLGCQYGSGELSKMDTLLTRSGSDPMDEAPPLFTGDKSVPWPAGSGSPALITIIQDQPLPCTVVAIMPKITTQDDSKSSDA